MTSDAPYTTESTQKNIRRLGKEVSPAEVTKAFVDMRGDLPYSYTSIVYSFRT